MSLIFHISDIKNYQDLADYLEVTTGYLSKVINDPNRYQCFEIPKKDNSLRSIYSPTKDLLVIQLKIKKLIEQNFNPHYKAHGFINGKDFITNAYNHIGKNFVLNLDLNNFFESISIKRVNNMFQRYFKVRPNISTVLAHICCHPDGFLPQGAPTSPIISNVICKSLDKDLTELAKSLKLTYYSRYADDITFSCKKKDFPKILAEDINGNIVLSNHLTNLIEKHGFKVNLNKTRLQSKYMHQEVTGITVNKKINLNRRYIKRIRAILYSFKKYVDEPDIPIGKFCEFYNITNNNIEETKYRIFNILKGHIIHISHVKGYNDSNFLDFMRKFNELLELYSLSIPAIKVLDSSNNFFKRNTLVIYPLNSLDDPQYFVDRDFIKNGNFEIDSVCYGQGSGFYLKDIGIVTNYHVVSLIIEEVLEKKLTFCKEYYLEYFTESNGKQYKYHAKIIAYDKEKDIAILKPKYPDLVDSGFKYNKRFNINDSITLLGFPNHTTGSEFRSDKGKIIRKIKNKNISTYEIDAKIFAGNSGGPVLNYKNEVIGIATKGFTDRGIVPPEFIPIKYAIEVYKNHTDKKL
ncbi:reverse transcriptase domain-containing protein [Lysinibacillus halotolerans]|uniref:RNA-directed DNA polymerase n=1 Tax=Lysinibacillus halotolerans TaxID=1368476 RepID=A0A3M8H4J5_9BACI|nr:reverse transcriptase domain-containing protein [Lysinibacillus halotolerans]RNC97313.1 RNA-dependent DNA polymerase [Lysinibacillus halotolerans]